MKIGALADATGTTVETIRFYERKGLMPQAARTEGNYRQYGSKEAERLVFIRHCRSLDMTLDEIGLLLGFRADPLADCSGVNDVLDRHIDHVTARIKELRDLEMQLRALRSQCREPAATNACGILAELAQEVSDGAGSATQHIHGTHP